MLIYKIFRADEMAAFLAAGETLGAPIDLADGYVHMSTADQVGETLAKHFAGETNLSLTTADVVWDKLLTPADDPSGFAPIWT